MDEKTWWTVVYMDLELGGEADDKWTWESLTWI